MITINHDYLPPNIGIEICASLHSTRYEGWFTHKGKRTKRIPTNTQIIRNLKEPHAERKQTVVFL